MSPLSSGWAQWRLTFLYLFIGEEEDIPTRKWVKWIESLKGRLDTAKADISGLVYWRGGGHPHQETGDIECVAQVEAGQSRD